MIHKTIRLHLIPIMKIVHDIYDYIVTLKGNSKVAEHDPNSTFRNSYLASFRLDLSS